MATLLELQTAILDISKNHYIQTESSVLLIARINEAVTTIAGGIRMPNGAISPPLPDLYESAVVATTVNAYASLPATYQRNVFYVADSSGDRILPPRNGSYYSFMQFLNNASKKDLSSTGSVYDVCVKGSKLYYQAIPSVSENLTVMFYRKPVDMALNTDTPDGIPSHLQTRLIKHYVGEQLAQEMVDGTQAMAAYHKTMFYTAMQDLVDFIGIDAEPVYYSSNSDFYDLGVCD